MGTPFFLTGKFPLDTFSYLSGREKLPVRRGSFIYFDANPYLMSTILVCQGRGLNASQVTEVKACIDAGTGVRISDDHGSTVDIRVSASDPDELYVVSSGPLAVVMIFVPIKSVMYMDGAIFLGDIAIRVNRGA